MAMRELAIMVSISTCVVGRGVIRQTWPRRFRASRIFWFRTLRNRTWREPGPAR